MKGKGPTLLCDSSMALEFNVTVTRTSILNHEEFQLYSGKDLQYYTKRYETKRSEGYMIKNGNNENVAYMVPNEFNTSWMVRSALEPNDRICKIEIGVEKIEGHVRRTYGLTFFHEDVELSTIHEKVPVYHDGKGCLKFGAGTKPNPLNCILVSRDREVFSFRKTDEGYIMTTLPREVDPLLGFSFSVASLLAPTSQ